MTRNNNGAGAKAGPENSGDNAEQPDISGLSEEIYDEALRERDEYLDSLKRLQAEFDNYRRRVQRETEQLRSRASVEVMEDILPVLDNFERALKAAIEHDEQLLSDGVQLVYGQLKNLLEKRGLCEIEAAGQPFDPTHHEAVLCRPSSEHGEGIILEVLEKGYHVDDRVVRPAKVIVSEGKNTTSKK